MTGRGMAACAASISVVVFGQTACGKPTPRQDLETLTRELVGPRSIEGRLWGVSAHSGYQGPRVAPSTSLGWLSRRALDAVTRITAAARQRATSEDLRVAADAELLLGRPDKAIGLLLDALTRSTADAAPLWTDLSAAYLASGETGESAEPLVNALDAAAAAVELAPGAREAWFNLGVAASALSLRSEALRALTHVLSLEASVEWKTETRDRMKGLAPRPDQWPQMSQRLADTTEQLPADLSSISFEFPQPVEEFLLDRIFPDWSHAFLDRDMRRADALAARANSLSDGLSRVAGDTSMSRCTAALHSAFDGNGPRGGPTALARAHLALAAGRQLYEQDRRDEAIREFESALLGFSRASTPCADWATLQMWLARAQKGDSAGALAIANRLEASAITRGYTSLRARSAWVAGLALSGEGRLEDALTSYRRAIAAYDSARQAEHRLFLRGSAADTLRLLGETETGWTYLLPALHALDSVGRVRRRYALLLNASLYATDARLFRAARLFQSGSLELAYERNVPNTIVEGLISRSTIELKLGRIDQASADLREAERLLPQISAPDVREYQSAWLARSVGDLEALVNPGQAIRHLSGIVEYFDRHEPAEVPAIFRSLGRAAVSLGRMAEADQAFLRGLGAFDQMWSSLPTDQYRVSYLSESWDLFDDLVELHASTGDEGGSLRYAESAREHAIGPLGSSVAPADLKSMHLEAGTVMLYFASLRDRLLIWRADAQGVELRSTAVGREMVARRTIAFRRLIESGAGRTEVDNLARELYQILIEAAGPLPDRAKVVVVPDGELPGLPFAALVNPRTGRYLIEEHALQTTPSAQLFERSRGRRAAQSPLTSSAWVLVIGNAPNGRMPALPSVEAELREVASPYVHVRYIEGIDATPAVLAREAPSAEIIHFAGHAKANAMFPWQSSLVLAADRTHSDGLLAAAEISRWTLPRTQLVVLSACQTAFGGGSRNPGLLGLARPFLLAGVPSVIGSLWDVDDRQTRPLMETFHKVFAQTGDPAAALQTAQLAVLRAPDPAGQLPRSWAAFLLVGG